MADLQTANAIKVYEGNTDLILKHNKILLKESQAQIERLLLTQKNLIIESDKIDLQVDVLQNKMEEIKDAIQKLEPIEVKGE